jgi:hypothetical protein
MSDPAAPAAHPYDLLPEPAGSAPAFATLIAADGRVIRLNPIGAGGGISLAIEGRKAVELDRFQAAAFRAAIAALPAEG